METIKYFLLHDALVEMVANKSKYKFDKIFSHATNKNIDLIAKEKEYYNKVAQDIDPKYKEYEQKKNEIGIKYSKKDEAGNPVIENDPDGSSYIVIADVDSANDEFIILSEEYKEVINTFNKHKADLETILKQDINIPIVKVSFNNFPDVDPDILNALRIMRKETDEEMDKLFNGEELLNE